jgi:type II secretory ATPase GspE/PulE/Tfp pilus assembly ATPase PilB-like protein
MTSKFDIIKAWGWTEPTKDLLNQAEQLSQIQSQSLTTGKIIVHLNVLSAQTIDTLDQASSANEVNSQFYDRLISVAEGHDRDALLTSKNRVLALSRGLQLVYKLDENIVIHNDMKQGSPLLAECKALNAVLCTIQHQRAVLIFPELNDTYMAFSTMGGADRHDSKLHAVLGPQPVLALAESDELIQAAYHDIESNAAADDTNNASSILLHKIMMDRGDDYRAIAIRKLATIHKAAIDLKATDIHIIPVVDSRYVRVSIRVFGEMKPLTKGHYFSREEYMQIKIYLTNASKATKDQQSITNTADGRYTYIINNRQIEVRVSFMNKGLELSHTQSEVSIRLRLLPKESGPVNLVEKRVPTKVIQHMRESMLTTSGMVLMTGPTGSGKSTTLFGLVELHRELYGDSKSRLALEDPIESSCQASNKYRYLEPAN